MQSNMWSSKMAFVLAAAGSAIGLGNIWRFPFISAENGGGNFIILYILFLLIIGVPLLMNEMLIGRNAKTNSILHMLTKLGKKHQLVGYLFIISSLLLMSYYIVVSGWALFYFTNTLLGNINYNAPDSKYYVDTMTGLFSSPFIITICSLVIIVITGLINIVGVSKGIEKFTTFMLPALFILLIIIAIRVLTLDGIGEGLKSYFTVDISLIDGKTVMNALSHTVFSLSLGSATMIVYGSYVDRKINIPHAALMVGILSILVGVFSGMIVVPALFVFDYPLDSGPSLTFIALPAIFSKLPYGGFFALLFFFIMVLAVLTTTISLVENIVPSLMEKFKLTRVKSTIITCSIIFIMSIPQGLSFNVLSDIKILGKNIFEFSDYIEANILLTSGALIGCLYGAYLLKDTLIKEANSHGIYNFKWTKLWLLALKTIIPFMLLIITIKAVLSF